MAHTFLCLRQATRCSYSETRIGWLDGDDKVIDPTTTGDTYHQDQEIKSKELEDYNSQFVPNARVHTYVTEDINTPQGARQVRRPPTLDLGAGAEEEHADEDGWRQSDQDEEEHRSAPSGHAK